MGVECADLAFRDSEARKQAYVWCRYLMSGLPMSSSLAISLLVCHVARETILPTDMLKWALEEYSCDLPTYFQYCKDMVFCGLNPPFDYVEEKELIEELWKFYQNSKGARTSDEKERSGDDC